jgi:hypothetical protein
VCACWCLFEGFLAKSLETINMAWLYCSDIVEITIVITQCGAMTIVFANNRYTV